MKWSKDQKYDCETYLQTLAMGIHSPVAEEHVANCNFCRDIYHGGSEEFPLSLKEAADQMRAEKRRKARRAFLGRAAVSASVAALTLATVFSFGTATQSRVTKGVRARLAADFSFFDAQYSRHGRTAIEGLVNGNAEEVACRVLRWIQSSGHTSLYDIPCRSLGGSSPKIQRQAFLSLCGIDPASLKPHIALILQAQASIKSSALNRAVEKLIVRIEDS